MNVSLAVSTARRGGVTLNYTQVIELHREKDADGNEVITGARIKDRLTGNNNTGIFVVFFSVLQFFYCDERMHGLYDDE